MPLYIQNFREKSPRGEAESGDLRKKTDVKGTSKNTPIFSTTLLIYFVMRTLFTFSAKNIKNDLGALFRNFKIKIKTQSIRFYLLYLESMGVESYNPGWRWIKNVPKSAISLDFIKESASHSSLSLE